MIAFIALVILALAIWFSAIERSLRNGSSGELLDALDRSGRIDLRNYLETRLDATADVYALQSWTLRVAFLAFWLWSIAGWNSTVEPNWTARAILAGVTAVPMLWLGCSVLATAIARWSGGGLLRSCLWSIRLSTIAGPFISWAPAFTGEIVRRLSGAHLHTKGADAEADLLRSIEAKHREGELAETAATLLENVVDFTSTDVGEVMTPRTEIEGIEMTDDLSAIRAFILEAGHSRIPVFEEDLDHITGILYVKDLIPFIGEDASAFSLQPLLRRPIIVPETKPVADLLADFQQAEVHMAIVVDEYGGTAGLATIEDVLEEIVGEIYDEHEGDDDDEEPQLTKVASGIWEVDGRFHIDDLNEAIESTLPEDDEYDTVGGWFTAQFGQVPVAGASIELHDLIFTVMAAEPTHVTRLRIAHAEA